MSCNNPMPLGKTDPPIKVIAAAMHDVGHPGKSGEMPLEGQSHWVSWFREFSFPKF